MGDTEFYFKSIISDDDAVLDLSPSMVIKVSWYVAEFLLQLGHIVTAERILLALHEKLAQVMYIFILPSLQERRFIPINYVLASSHFRHLLITMQIVLTQIRTFK